MRRAISLVARRWGEVLDPHAISLCSFDCFGFVGVLLAATGSADGCSNRTGSLSAA
jgi:hypothetical protein